MKRKAIERVVRTVLAGLISCGALFGIATSANADCAAIVGNLVTNCGFETGDFTGWTTTPAAVGMSVFGVDGNPHSGNFAAFFGAEGPSPDTISQPITTTPGQAYNVSFFLSSSFADERNPNGFTATFDGTTLLSLTNADNFDYTEFTDTVVATAGTTLLSFAAFNSLAFFFLDDVSVVAASVPEPTSLALLGTGLLGLGLLRLRHKAS